jgi:hypothetical protein
MGIALRRPFISHPTLPKRAITPDPERNRSKMGVRLNEKHRPAMSFLTQLTSRESVSYYMRGSTREPYPEK